MTADTEWELHLMADAIGLRREWYQRAHYDISSKAKVSKALMLGAKVIPRSELAARRRQLLGDLQAKEAEHGAER